MVVMSIDSTSYTAELSSYMPDKGAGSPSHCASLCGGQFGDIHQIKKVYTDSTPWHITSGHEFHNVPPKNVHSSINNSPILKTTHMPINSGMDEYIVVYSKVEHNKQ